MAKQSVGPMETIEFRQQVAGQRDPWAFLATNMSDGTLRGLGSSSPCSSRTGGRRPSLASRRLLAAARGVSETTAQAFDDDEDRLLNEVARREVETGARLMRAWAAAADPAADEASHTEREAKRKVNLSTSLDGMGFLDGLLTSEANAVAASELETIIDDLHRNGLSTGADGNRLTAAQLRHDALVEMAHRASASSTAVEVRRDAHHRAEQAAGSQPGTAPPTETEEDHAADRNPGEHHDPGEHDPGDSTAPATSTTPASSTAPATAVPPRRRAPLVRQMARPRRPGLGVSRRRGPRRRVRRRPALQRQRRCPPTRL